MSDDSRTCRIGPRWQLTVPKDVREHHDLKPGDYVAILVTRNGTLFIPRNRPVRSLFGMLEEYREGTNVPLERHDEAAGRSVLASNGAAQPPASEAASGDEVPRTTEPVAAE